MFPRYTIAFIALLAAAPVAQCQPVLYVATHAGSTVRRIPGPAQTFLYANGLSNGRGIAIDSMGNLYAANNFTDSLSIIAPGGGVPQPFATGFVGPRGVTLGPDGFLYVADEDDVVRRVSLSGGVATTFATGFNDPAGLRFGADGNLYVANAAGNTVSRVGPAGGAASVFATGFNDPRDVTFDALGNMYVTNFDADTVTRVGPAGGTGTIFATGFSQPFGLEFDPQGSGRLFVSCNLDDEVRFVEAAGGASSLYAINVTDAGYMAVQIPEPSALALGAMFAGGAIVRRVRGQRRSGG